MLLNWTEIHILCAGKNALALSDHLQELGAKAVTFKDAEDQPIYEPDPKNILLWDKTIVIGLFEKEDVTDGILQDLKKYGELSLHQLENKDWVRLSLSQFKPMQFGKLWVCPTWIKPPDPSAINVLLDPGLAFGTGKHPTTSLCIEWLVNNINQENVVIDYGCGSGILGITAFKLGAEKVFAVDLDEQALIATRSNANLNKINGADLQTFFPNELPPIKCDLLIANILAQPIMKLVKHFNSLVKPQGRILLSGILENQMQDVINIYQPYFSFREPIIQEGWVCLSGTRCY